MCVCVCVCVCEWKGGASYQQQSLQLVDVDLLAGQEARQHQLFHLQTLLYITLEHTHTGQLEKYTHTGQLDRYTHTGQLEKYTHTQGS